MSYSRIRTAETTRQRNEPVRAVPNLPPSAPGYIVVTHCSRVEHTAAHGWRDSGDTRANWSPLCVRNFNDFTYEGRWACSRCDYEVFERDLILPHQLVHCSYHRRPRTLHFDAASGVLSWVCTSINALYDDQPEFHQCPAEEVSYEPLEVIVVDGSQASDVEVGVEDAADEVNTLLAIADGTWVDPDFVPLNTFDLSPEYDALAQLLGY